MELAVTPIITTRTTGTIVCDSEDEAEEFGEKFVRLANALTNGAATAIGNS